ncbi:MAG: hypothetical protein NW217_01255 [Hyphomicrobiaceae bacterium]|nr:hypothetical protein [Hyphomicrobiaceae bacterium]
MSDAYIIEIADETAGIVVRQAAERSFQFHASLPRYYPLDGTRFATPREAERAALELFLGKVRQRKRAA